MSQFSIYFQLGFHHIVSWGAIDHILFIIALCLKYQFADWKRVLILITAFTIGHAISLIASMFQLISFSNSWIEFLITITILITAFHNVLNKKTSYSKGKITFIYASALVFGLIHGLAFSSDLKMVIGNGDLVWLKLLFANIGIEAAQLLFVFILLLVNLICLRIIKINFREYTLFISSAIFGIALYLSFIRQPF
ncbi:MAG: HupE/UreJ family protein [Chitinophagaceae bacterium]|nr:HupE/UreJ family protein [Chitinophagaceae bacterium]